MRGLPERLSYACQWGKRDHGDQNGEGEDE
jgi:hypothetical protein